MLRIQASSTGPPRGQHSKGQVANSRPEPESIYPKTAGAIPDTYNVRPQERHAPIHQTPLEESSSSTRLSLKRQRDRRPQLFGTMRARLGPQEPGRPLYDALDWHRATIYSAAQPEQKQEPRRPRPLVAPTRGTHPDPMVTPLMQNVPPHRDPMVTPMVQNVPSYQAVRQAGKNLPNEPPSGSISKRLDDMLATLFCSHIIHYEPSRGFLVPKFSTYDGASDPFDHIMHYR